MARIDLTTLQGRLARFAELRYGSMRKLATAIEVNYNNLTSYGDGKLPSGPIIQKLIAAGCNAHWLFTGDGPMLTESAADVVIALGSADRQEEVVLASSSLLEQIAENALRILKLTGTVVRP